MARSANNRKEAAEKKRARSAPRPKAQITARAKLVNVASATGKEKGAGTYGAVKTVNAVRLTIDVNMGAPANAPGWPEYKARNSGWSRTDFIDRELRKLRPSKPAKAKKAKKGEPDPAAPATMAEAFDEAAEKRRLGEQYDAQLRTKWERECAKANNANARFMQRAAAFAMFLALRGQDVQLTLSPIQQGFTELFAGQPQPAELPAGQEHEDDAAGDMFNEDEGYEDGDE